MVPMSSHPSNGRIEHPISRVGTRYEAGRSVNCVADMIPIPARLRVIHPAHEIYNLAAQSHVK